MKNVQDTVLESALKVVEAAKAVDNWRTAREASGEVWPAGDFHPSEQDLREALASHENVVRLVIVPVVQSLPLRLAAWKVDD